MAGARHRRQRFQAQAQGAATLLLLVGVLSGCKSGSWAAKPSWWGGGAGSSSLASAPAFDGDVKKPSEAAKPYPTTETPEAYSLARAPGGDAAPATPTIEATSVTYGATPPPTSQAAAPPPAAVTPPPAAPIGPQVGPYASLQPATPNPSADPAAAVTAGLAAAPAFGEAAAPAATRVADARGSDAWASAPPPAATGADARYGTANGSRFSSAFQPAAAEPPAMAPLAAPAAAPPAPAASFAPPAPASIDPAPTATPPGFPPATPPAATADPLPGSISPPRRRADPGYRPGGTSSYRPSRAILADDESATGVVPASFEAAGTAGQ
ncbi:MAG: hypothetical protein ACKOCX_11105 [Planctomycetota bacterium]